MSQQNPNPDDDVNSPETSLPSPTPIQFEQASLDAMREHMEGMMSFTFGLRSHAEARGDTQLHPRLSAGALFSVLGSIEGQFQIAKVLAVDEGGVHIRLYTSAWPKRPTAVAPDLLDVTPVVTPKEDRDDERWPVSVGHMALSHPTFNALEPVFIIQESVDESELEGYRFWNSMEGEYF
jgi:hypothetical protein